MKKYVNLGQRFTTGGTETNSRRYREETFLSSIGNLLGVGRLERWYGSGSILFVLILLIEVRSERSMFQ